MESESLKRDPLIIMGSSRSCGNTWKVVSTLNRENRFPVIDLNTLTLFPFDYEGKNRGDDYLALAKKMVTHRTLIWATPVYWYTMSAQMKMFLDRFSDLLFFERELGRELEGKRVFLLVSFEGKEHPATYHFDLPFRNTCAYLKMKYEGSFYYYSGKNAKQQSANANLDSFYQTILQ